LNEPNILVGYRDGESTLALHGQAKYSGSVTRHTMEWTMGFS